MFTPVRRADKQGMRATNNIAEKRDMLLLNTTAGEKNMYIFTFFC
jgi:hypothetical protein